MKKRKKKLPIGLSDFKEIIEYDYYYFDKTKFIENILEDRSKVKLFTRPRRFGKTLNISMLKYFFDVKNKDENKNLFEGLNISKSEYFNKQGEFPVISISFKDYNEKKWESGFREVKGIIERLYTKYKFLTKKRDEIEIEKFNSIRRTLDLADWKNSLLNLSKYLYEYYGKKVIVLIDEYDQPIINSYINGYYNETIDFFKSFYGSVLKDNEYLEMSVITGILRVAKENIFSGLNNLEVHTILDSEFTEYFGIMENEVEDALKDFGLEYELEDVQKWYNGYLFGDTKVYNPWSIINFLKKGKLRPYWVNTSGNGLIKLYLQKLKDEIFDESLSEKSKNIQERVIKAREIQKQRFNSNTLNRDMNKKQLNKYCKIDKESQEIMKAAIDNLKLSVRMFDKILKISRTIADLDGQENIKKEHLLEALNYRKKQ